MSNALALLLIAGGAVAVYSGIKGVGIVELLQGALKITAPQPVPAAAP